MKKLILSLIFTITLFIPSSNASSDFIENPERNSALSKKIHYYIAQHHATSKVVKEYIAIRDSLEERLKQLSLSEKTLFDFQENNQTSQAQEDHLKTLLQISDIERDLQNVLRILSELTDESKNISNILATLNKELLEKDGVASPSSPSDNSGRASNYISSDPPSSEGTPQNPLSPSANYFDDRPKFTVTYTGPNQGPPSFTFTPTANLSTSAPHTPPLAGNHPIITLARHTPKL